MKQVTIAAVFAVLAAACSVGQPSTSRPGPVPATSVAVDAAALATAIDRLKAGTAFVDQVSFVAEVVIADGQVLIESHMDNVRKRAVSTTTGPGAVVEIRMIGDDVYMLAPTLPTAPKGWMILDPAKVPAGFDLSFAPGKNDPGGSARLISAIISARASGNEVSGTIDVVKLGKGNGISFQTGQGAALPDSVRSQEFRATLDGQGRLESFVIPGSRGVPRAGLSYRGFGTRVTVTPPSGAVPAPETVYPQMGLR